ncbi:hypothetical protein FHX75_112081 [Micromonospora palomenae]|uniref:Uncharacterized protein n=1 Tax=Micromonospora palomenae TaxID=1461247 RepID=A0A561WYH5_9ACTN|nr:hypothetical protein [Micromonospora palomenae]TWG28922.1 hypothetical protein FHX75_112081 [Micromonospora palomenae]
MELAGGTPGKSGSGQLTDLGHSSSRVVARPNERVRPGGGGPGGQVRHSGTTYDIEENWDFLIVETHEAGSDAWTTLPDAGGLTGTETGDSCAGGWAELHPVPRPPPGRRLPLERQHRHWNTATGSSSGWKVFTAEISFETPDLGGWTVARRPPGSAPGARRQRLSPQPAGVSEGAAVVTDDTVYLGFGLVGLAPAARDRVLTGPGPASPPDAGPPVVPADGGQHEVDDPA